MTANAFTKRWLIALTFLFFFAAVSLFAIPTLAVAMGCEAVGGACGAVALALGVYLRVPVVIGLGIYVAALAWKRSTTLHLQPWGFIFVAASYLASSNILFAFGNYWASSFALGVIISEFVPLGFLLVGLAGLSLLPEGNRTDEATTQRKVTFAVGALSLILLLPQIVFSFLLFPFITFVFLPTLYPLRLLSILDRSMLPIVLIVFTFALAYWVKVTRAVHLEPAG